MKPKYFALAVMLVGMVVGGFLGRIIVGVDTVRYLNLDTGEVEVHIVDRGGLFVGAMSGMFITAIGSLVLRDFVSYLNRRRKKDRSCVG